MIDVETSVSTAIQAKDGKLVVHRVQDVAPILDFNKKMQASAAGGWRRAQGTRRHIAEIPNIVAEAWLRQGFNMFSASDKELRKKLDEPEWAYLKTIPGRIGQRSRHI